MTTTAAFLELLARSTLSRHRESPAAALPLLPQSS